jgi:hypothetical protein
MDDQISRIMGNTSGDLSKFLTSELIRENLHVPISGTYFFVTSRGTIFNIKHTQNVTSSAYANYVDFSSLFLPIFIYVINM